MAWRACPHSQNSRLQKRHAPPPRRPAPFPGRCCGCAACDTRARLRGLACSRTVARPLLSSLSSLFSLSLLSLLVPLPSELLPDVLPSSSASTPCERTCVRRVLFTNARKPMLGNNDRVRSRCAGRKSNTMWVKPGTLHPYQGQWCVGHRSASTCVPHPLRHCWLPSVRVFAGGLHPHPHTHTHTHTCAHARQG